MTSTVQRVLLAPPEEVWDVLCDGWLYPLWVTGASRMREVDDGWPAVGCRLHHSVGSWPLLVDDTTSVVAQEPRRRLVLQARAWPAGEATVDLRLAPDPRGTLLTMVEDASHGPGALVPGLVRRPLLTWRNRESLQRLALVVENRQRSQVRARD
jgi:uncharacterized protein YndB with AHSA1/START domain